MISFSFLELLLCHTLIPEVTAVSTVALALSQSRVSLVYALHYVFPLFQTLFGLCWAFLFLRIFFWAFSRLLRGFSFLDWLERILIFALRILCGCLFGAGTLFKRGWLRLGLDELGWAFHWSFPLLIRKSNLGWRHGRAVYFVCGLWLLLSSWSLVQWDCI